jgi:transketolase
LTLSAARIDYLNEKCQQFRVDLIQLLYKIQTGHPGGSLSAVEILTALYYEKLNIQPDNPAYLDRDRFVLGKGHAAPMLYLVLAEKGYFPKAEMNTLRQLNSRLQGHPCANLTPGVDLSSGPLGLGISAAVGMAAAAKLDNKKLYTYVLMGDGEIQEGIVWEAAMAASKFKLDNLIGIIDYNGVQLDGTVEEIMPLGNLADKWKSFGWQVLEINGHDCQEILTALEKSVILGKENSSPVMIIANTIKGKGVSFMENNASWHGKGPNAEEFKLALEEIRG